MSGFLIVILCLALAFIVAVLIQPDRFIVTRSAIIDAPPEVVFRQINNLRNWESWSPWAKLDPGAAREFDGPAAGPGASFNWSGNNKIGAGRMSIVDARPNQRVDIKLDMTKPIAASNDAMFTLTPVLAPVLADGASPATSGWEWVSKIFGLGATAGSPRTRIDWTMTGKSGFVGKAMNLVMNGEKMCGKQFEDGLANLAAVLNK